MAPVSQEAAASSGNDDVLLSVFPAKCDGSRMSAGIDPGYPQFLTGLGIERPESAVVRRSDEDQAAGRGQGSANVRPAGILLVGRKTVRDSKGTLPRDIAGIHIDGK